jgi:hypothetical protein
LIEAGDAPGPGSGIQVAARDSMVCIWASGVFRRGNCFRQILGRMASHTGQYCQVARAQGWSWNGLIILFYFIYFIFILGFRALA